MAKKQEEPDMDMDLQKAFTKTIKRQQVQDKIEVNRKEISKLGQIIEQSPEMKKIRAFGKQNKSLGQTVSLIQAEIDRTIVRAENRYRKKVINQGKNNK